MSLRKLLLGQFHHPEGWLGKVAGWMMANRASNVLRGDLTLALLDITRSDRVCELGPGPGVLLEKILAQCDSVVAVDHSALMIDRCRRRNKQAVDEGRLRLLQGSFTQMPDIGEVDIIIGINSLQFDALEGKSLAQISNHLADGGRFVITLQPRNKSPQQADVDRLADRICTALREAGLEIERTERLELEPVGAVCVIARKNSALLNPD